jgi:hypothetical protein
MSLCQADPVLGIKTHTPQDPLGGYLTRVRTDKVVKLH